MKVNKLYEKIQTLQNLPKCIIISRNDSSEIVLAIHGYVDFIIVLLEFGPCFIQRTWVV